MTFNQDGNMIGRIGAVAVIGLTLWGVHKVSCEAGFCPTMNKPAASCCPTEAPQSASAAAPAAK